MQWTSIAGLIFFFILFTLSACDTNDNECEPDPRPMIVGPEARVVADADYTTSSTGLKHFDFMTGSGPAASVGDTVFVDYTGWYSDGGIFDSSVHIPGRSPFPVIIGEMGVIAGWDEGLQGMQTGGQRQLVIPPALAYGQNCRGSIASNSTLIFEVEIVSLNGQ